MHENPAKFDADVFSGQGQIGQMTGHIVAVLNAVRVTGRTAWKSQLVRLPGPRRTESSRVFLLTGGASQGFRVGG